MNSQQLCGECGLEKYTTKNDKERGRCNICSKFQRRSGVDHHEMLDDLIHRIHFVGLCKAGKAQDAGYAEARSLRVVLDVAKKRLKELDVIDKEVKRHKKGHFIHSDRMVIQLLAERGVLAALVQKAEELLHG